MTLRNDRLKVTHMNSMEELIAQLTSLKAQLDTVDGKLADDAAMLAEITASYNVTKTNLENAITAKRSAIATLRDAVGVNDIYSAGEKAEFADMATNEA
jgi:hypothetical protein